MRITRSIPPELLPEPEPPQQTPPLDGAAQAFAHDAYAAALALSIAAGGTADACQEQALTAALAALWEHYERQCAPWRRRLAGIASRKLG